MHRCLVILATASVLLVGRMSASAKLPPLELTAPPAVPFGDVVSVRMWFVDGDGRLLAGSEVRKWGMTELVRGWVWAYPAEDGRPDPDHSGLRVRLAWKHDHYEGGFRPDEPGAWLAIPFGADHAMPDPSGPLGPVLVSVERRAGTVDAPRPDTATGRGNAIAAGLGALAVLGAAWAVTRRRYPAAAR